jgi:hypothetical protein
MYYQVRIAAMIDKSSFVPSAALREVSRREHEYFNRGVRKAHRIDDFALIIGESVEVA